MALGRPVVPLEYTTQSGWSNGSQTAQVVHRAVGRREAPWIGARVAIAIEDDVVHARQAVEDGAHDLHPVVLDAAVAIAVAGDQQLRLDLAKAVEHGDRPHVGRAHRPDGAEAGDGEEGHRRDRRVRQEGADPVPWPDAKRLQGCRQGAHLATQLRPAQLDPLAALAQAFVLEDEGRMAGGVVRIGVPEQVLRIVDPGPGKPARAGHRLVGEHALERRLRLEPEVVPDRRPEGTQVADRPAPERVVTLDGRRVEGEAAGLLQPAGVAEDPGFGDAHRPILCRVAALLHRERPQVRRLRPVGLSWFGGQCPCDTVRSMST